MRKVYLDYAATTPVDEGVLKAMLLYSKDKYGNPSSVHSWGQEAAQAIDKAREQVAKFLNCKPMEIIFTGSATESNNLAIKGLIPSERSESRGHIITTSIEHKSVLETCKDFKTFYLPVDRQGLISIKDLEKNIKKDTRLISIMYANNETGVVQEIEKIGKLIANINKKRENKIYFHTDAVQSGNWFDLNVEKLGVDLLTLSGHKIYGPKGVGVLYIRKGTPIKPIITGGDHELGLRAGTENVAGIVGLGEAVSRISRSHNARIEKLRDKLVKEVLKIKGSKLNGPSKKENRLPNIANFSFNGVEGEGLIIALDQEGIAVSTGSACTSKALTSSHVLIAMGLSDEQAHSSLRASLGRHTTTADVDYFLKALPKVINKLRKISGYV